MGELPENTGTPPSNHTTRPYSIKSSHSVLQEQNMVGQKPQSGGTHRHKSPGLHENEAPLTKPSSPVKHPHITTQQTPENSHIQDYQFGMACVEDLAFHTQNLPPGEPQAPSQAKGNLM